MKIVFNQDTKKFKDFANYQDLVMESSKAFGLSNQDIS